MDLGAAYPLLKLTHVGLVSTSVALFALRGFGTLARAGWPMAAGLRWTVVGVDTLLLASGGLLWFVLRLNPLQQTWLGTKLVLLVAYVLLGSLALRRARSTGARAAAWVAALACVATMASIAWTHDPRGWLNWL